LKKPHAKPYGFVRRIIRLPVESDPVFSGFYASSFVFRRRVIKRSSLHICVKICSSFLHSFLAILYMKQYNINDDLDFCLKNPALLK